ncbi:MAG: hypothetical protein ACK4IX_01820, partial [Candidatus Sericytochromatia bacterium]
YTIFFKNKLLGVVFLCVISVSIVILVLLNIIGLYDLKEMDRFLSIFSNTDSSGEVRGEILRTNILDLPNKILIGNPNYFVDNYNNLGEYIHNILSIWEFYGFIFFTIIIYVICSNLRFLIKNRKNISENTTGRFASFGLIFVILSILVAKSAFYYPFWFVLGFWFFYRSYYKERVL